MAMATTEQPRRKRPKATAHYFSISDMTLWRWGKRPGFPAPLRKGGVILHDIDAIESWLKGSE